MRQSHQSSESMASLAFAATDFRYLARTIGVLQGLAKIRLGESRDHLLRVSITEHIDAVTQLGGKGLALVEEPKLAC